MDRNQLIGILLILAMLVGYQLLVPRPKTDPATTQASTRTRPDSATASQPTSASAGKTITQPTAADSAANRARFGEFATVATGQARDVVFENVDIRVTFTTQGGRVKSVLLKKYKTYTQQPLFLVDEASSRTSLALPTQRGVVDLHDIYYQTAGLSPVVSGKPQQLTFRAEPTPGHVVEQTYTLPIEGYTISYNLNLKGLENTLAPGDLRFRWQDKMLPYENDLTENRKSATINYLTADNNFDGLPQDPNTNHDKLIDQPVQWFTIKHKYFLSGFIADHTPLSKPAFQTLVDVGDTSTVKTAIAEVGLPMADVRAGKGQYKFYFGPNDFQIVSDVAPDFNRNIYLGYAFLKPINQYFFVPVFGVMEGLFSHANYGLLIIALVLFVKLLLTPLTYRSYVSMAKMRVLAPEIAEIKERVGEDAAKQQSEQMKLYQQVGVSPLNGCIPVLATMPILMSLFFLFPNLIELRQRPFLWSSDLSTYDAFFQFPFMVPFIGNHLSLFTVMMTASSILYAWYNNQTTPQQPGPVDMRTLSYVMPLMFMAFLNSSPAGLTFYYFISNIITITQQQLIRRFVDESKIKAVLDENRRKNATGEGKKPGKFQAILQKQLQAAEEARKQADESQKRAETKFKKKP